MSPRGSGDSGLALAIVTHDSVDELREFFAGQVSAAAALGASLVVVDNASIDGSADFVREVAGDEGRLIRNARNEGYAAAVNQAFTAVPNRDVFLVNADVELDEPGDVSMLADFLASNERAGIAAPRLLEPDGSAQQSARPFPSVLAMGGHASVLRRLPAARRAADRYLAPPESSRPTRVDWAIGAALMIRRQAYDEVGGFDERFFLYLEDTDFCLRAARAGWETWYVPSVQLHHVHERSSDPGRGGFLTSPARRRHVASMLRFFARYPRLIAGGRR